MHGERGERDIVKLKGIVRERNSNLEGTFTARKFLFRLT